MEYHSIQIMIKNKHTYCWRQKLYLFIWWKNMQAENTIQD